MGLVLAKEEDLIISLRAEGDHIGLFYGNEKVGRIYRDGSFRPVPLTNLQIERLERGGVYTNSGYIVHSRLL